MIDLKDVKQIRGLQSNLRAVFGTEQGLEVMALLEQICGWYDFTNNEPNQILIAHGKRQVLATLKTLLELTPEQVAQITKEQYNG